MHVNICICMYMLVSSCITCFNTVQINSFITSMPRGGFYTRFKRWVLHQVPSAHCKILLPALSTFHSSRRALRHWCIRAMCCQWSAVPCGPCSGSPLQPSSFFLVEDWNLAHNQPASRIGTHIVLQAAERHWESGVQSHSLHKTSNYNINMYKYIHLQSHTYTYAHSYFAIFLSINQQYMHIYT
jgi:hypothetical protein